MRSVLNAVAAVVVSAALLGVLGFGYGTIPALGPALDPGRGAWTSASGGQPASSQTLHVPGLTAPVSVSYSSQGLASIDAANTHDLFLALGYVHAKFRLSEIDAERRLGEGRLAQLAGPSDLASDEFELRLGLLRTAQNEWARTTGPPAPRCSRTPRASTTTSPQVRAAGDWPALFTLSGPYPAPWTPVDSLVVQGVLTQELDYTTGPLDEAVLGAVARRGAAPRTGSRCWRRTRRRPMTRARTSRRPLTPVAPDAASPRAHGGSVTTTAPVHAGGHGRGDTGRRGSAPTEPVGGRGGGGTACSTSSASCCRTQIHQYPDTNAWAANGPAVQGRRRAARRRPAPAADATVGLVRGGAVRAGVPGGRGQRAGAARGSCSGTTRTSPGR